MRDRCQRDGFLVIAVLITLGTAAELASERHWHGAVQLIPWVAIALLIAAIAFAVGRGVTQAPVRRWNARWLAGIVVVSGLVGVYEHVAENYRAGPLDYRYTDRWPSMSTGARFWAAMSKTVGPAPVLAPGALCIAALCVVLATLPASEARGGAIT